MPLFVSRRALAGSLSLALCIAPLSVRAQVTYVFNLSTQPLADSLRAVGSQTGVDIAFDPARTQGRNAPILKGTYSAQQALERLLEGSGSVLQVTAGGSFLVQAAPVTPPSPSSAPRRPASPSPPLSLPPTPSGLPTELAQLNVSAMHAHLSDLETAQPVSTITQADIRKAGLVNMGDILQSLIIAGQPTFSRASVLNSNTEEGGQYINLYSLGEQRVLILVNGKRWMTSLSGYADLSSIPSTLIDHIDVLKDGASAVYGSDAVAGVIDIILKGDYNGAEFISSVGQNQKGDGTQQAYSLTVGSTGDKSSVVFSASYNKTDPVWADERSLTNYTYGPEHALQGLSVAGPWGRFQAVDPTTGATSGPSYVLNHSGSWNGIGVGADATQLSDYHLLPSTGLSNDDRFNPTQQEMAQLGSELKSIFTQASYNLTDNIRFKAGGMYSERNSEVQVAGYPLNSLSQPGFPIYISGQSYYNPEPGQDLFFYRRIAELPRDTNESAQSYHVDASLEGAFDVGSHNWSWDAGANYNKYDVSSVNTGNLNLLNLQKALGPSFLDSAGVVRCGTAAAPIANCVPFNILGGPSASTAAALNYIDALEQSNEQSITKDYTANLAGGLFDMPWGSGTFSFAAGYEHRQISGYDHPDELASAGYTTDLVAGSTSGSYHTDEFYVEFDIPLLKDLPGAKELSFDVASRYAHYNNFGSTVNNKYSFLWRPIDDLIVRGTFAHGFRAPTLQDTFGSGSRSFDYYTDPCDMNYGSISNPTVAANCKAAGLPANFRQRDASGAPVSGLEGEGATPFQIGYGNATLKPEYSLTRTVGLVYSPSYVSGLDFTLDYYKINIGNVITAISADYVLNQCYQYSVQSYCNDFSRDSSTGQVVDLKRGNVNLGSLNTSGYTFGASYHLPEFSYGKFVVTFDTNYLKNYTTISTAGAPAIDLAGQWSYPHFRANAGLDWQLGDWGATWQIRYYGSFKDECWNGLPTTIECNEPTYNNPSWPYGEGANRKGAIVYNDAQVRYQLPRNGSIALGSRDIFNKHPPIVYSSSGSSSGLIDPILDLGRYFYLQYDQRF